MTRTGLIASVATVCLGAGTLLTPATARAAVTALHATSPSSQTETASGTMQVGSFTTDTPSDSFTATIDWGDGNSSAATLTPNGSSFDVSGAHTYAEDGTYAISFTVTETGASPDVETSNTVNVSVSEGSFVLSGAAPITATEGTAWTGTVATFDDPGSSDPPSAYTATVDWGDGTTSGGVITGSGGSFTVSGTHTYGDEIQSGAVLVTVSEPAVNFSLGPNPDSLTVTEGDVFSATPATVNATDTQAFSGPVATFSDTNTNVQLSGLTATINWGDGVSSAGTVSGSGGNLTVSGSHIYNAAPGSYPVSVTLDDVAPGTATATAASTALVSAAAPSATTQGATSLSVGGVTLHGTVDPNGADTTYHFQYGTSGGYGSSTADFDAGSGNSGEAVSAALTGLSAGETYHYRLVATNSVSTTYGADETFTTVGGPSVSLLSPLAGAVYAQGQVVTASFTCSDAIGGAGIQSCTDQQGRGSGSAIDTSTPGHFTYTVTATSSDGQTNVGTVSYTVAGPPTASISAPTTGGSYLLDEHVSTAFACSEGADGSGLTSCVDSNGASAQSGSLDTSAPGLHTYTVTATSKDGQQATAKIQYTVVGAPAITLAAPLSGAKFVQGQRVRARYSCSDPDGPGIASCSAAVADGVAINTTRPGRHHLTITAVSKDGRRTTVTSYYYVRAAKPARHVTPNGRVSVAYVHTGAHDTITLGLRVTGPGQLEIAETPAPGTRASGAIAGRRLSISRAQLVKVVLTPSSAGRRLLMSTDDLRVNVSVSYRPAVGKAQSVTLTDLISDY